MMRSRSAVSTLAVLTIGSSAGADVVQAAYLNDSEFEYEVRHMPDFDQNRAGLPNDGACYCSPTAMMNVLAYIANHGFPQVTPGPGFWQSAQLYAVATSHIDDLGASMNTSMGEPPEGTVCGTGASGGYWGLRAWLDPYGIFIVGDQKSDQDFTPSFASIAKSMIAGNLGTVTYGRYDVLGRVMGIPVVQRSGGHVTTVVKCSAGAGGRFLWVRDPDDENPVEIDAQSAFVSRKLEIVETYVVVVNSEGEVVGTQAASALNIEDDQMRILDGHRWVRLKEGYSLTDGGGTLSVIRPMSLGTLELTPPSGTPILSVSRHPDGHAYYLVSAGPAGGTNAVHLISGLTGESEPIAASDPALVSVGQNRRLYVYDPPEVWCRTVDSETEGVSIISPFPIDAMTFDDDAMELVALSTIGHKLMRFPALLDASPAILDLPTALPLGAEPRIAIDPTDGLVWLASGASSSLYRLSQGPAGGPMVFEEMSHPLVVDPEGIDFDDRGRLFVASGGSIVELEHTGPGLLYGVVTDGIFAGAAAEGLLHVARGRTNATPRHDGPEWENIPHGERLVIGEAFPDCHADVDGNGVVDVDDLVAVILGWGSALHDRD
ncbi:MAG: NHL repeat-containing protein, partial [Planctomycetota bacterium]